MRMMRTLAAILLLSSVAIAQARPEFEVASIRPSADQGNQAVSVGLSFNSSQVRIAYMSLKDYVGMAFEVPPNQVTGPDWLGQVRYDIAAKMPDGAKTEQVGDMLQALLTERFQLKVHREQKEFSVYALAVAKSGLKLTESPTSPDAPAGAAGGVTVAASGSGAGIGIDMGGGSSFNFANNRLEIRKMPMEVLTDVLTRFVDRRVVDTTALKGRYDLSLELAPEDYTGMMIRSAINAGVVLPPQALRALDAASADPLSVPLQKYGLTLESRRMPLDVIVVDSMQKTPTEN